MFVRLSVRPGPETHIPKKPIPFRFRSQEIKGLSVYGHGAGQGRGRARQGRAGAGAGQGGQGFSVTGRYLLAAPIGNRAGQGRAARDFQLLAVIF